MIVGGAFHLTYCSNIHPGETWSDVAAALASSLPRVRALLGHRGPFAVGLRLSAQAAETLEQPSVVLLHSMYATYVETWFAEIWPLLAPAINETRAGYGLASVAAVALQRVGGHVEPHDAPARLQEMARHGAAHGAQPDETDGPRVAHAGTCPTC